VSGAALRRRAAALPGARRRPSPSPCAPRPPARRPKRLGAAARRRPARRPTSAPPPPPPPLPLPLTARRAPAGELNNLLRFLPGYIASQMNWKNGQAQGFALFESGHLAKAACDRIASVQFDEVHALRCELARKNMYIKEDPSLKKPRFNGAAAAYGAPAPFPGAPFAGGVPPPVQPAGFAPVTNANDNPPCSTLFVGNLGDSVSEAELRGLFGNQPVRRRPAARTEAPLQLQLPPPPPLALRPAPRAGARAAAALLGRRRGAPLTTRPPLALTRRCARALCAALPPPAGLHADEAQPRHEGRHLLCGVPDC
jgi:hypothetical protein